MAENNLTNDLVNGFATLSLSISNRHVSTQSALLKNEVLSAISRVSAHRLQILDLPGATSRTNFGSMSLLDDILNNLRLIASHLPTFFTQLPALYSQLEAQHGRAYAPTLLPYAQLREDKYEIARRIFNARTKLRLWVQDFSAIEHDVAIMEIFPQGPNEALRGLRLRLLVENEWAEKREDCRMDRLKYDDESCSCGECRTYLNDTERA